MRLKESMQKTSNDVVKWKESLMSLKLEAVGKNKIAEKAAEMFSCS